MASAIAKTKQLWAYFQATKSGEARDALVEHLMPCARSLVPHIANSVGFVGSNDDFETIICDAVQRGVERFDPGRGALLETYLRSCILNRVRAAMEANKWFPNRGERKAYVRTLDVAHVEQKLAGRGELHHHGGQSNRDLVVVNDESINIVRYFSTKYKDDLEARDADHQEECVEKVKKILDRLNEADRALLVAYYLEGKSYREIGQEWNTLHNVIGRKIQVALGRARKVAQEVLGEPGKG